MHGVAGQKRIERTFLERYATPVPDLATQQRAVERIAGERARHERLAGMVRQQIDLLETRRRSLIAAAVTGQLDA